VAAAESGHDVSCPYVVRTDDALKGVATREKARSMLRHYKGQQKEKSKERV